MNKSHLAMVFPGQGSQSLGMLADIAAVYPEVQTTFSEASEVLGYDLWKLTQQGPATELDQTTHTQPALLAASYAIWRIVMAQSIERPTLLAGHSLGEYTALVCAQALEFSTAIQLVAARGAYMQAAVAPNEGAMAAIIGLDDEIVAEVCRKSNTSEHEMVAPANFNSVGQVVIAGHRLAVERAMALAKEAGARLVILIPVSVPSHCALMLPAAKQLAELLKNTTFTVPAIPVVNNVDVRPYTDAATIRDGLTRQLSSPVRWVETIEYFLAAGVDSVIECGPGKILTGLTKRIAKNLPMLTTNDLPNLTIVLERSA